MEVIHYRETRCPDFQDGQLRVDDDNDVTCPFCLMLVGYEAGHRDALEEIIHWGEEDAGHQQGCQCEVCRTAKRVIGAALHVVGEVYQDMAGELEDVDPPDILTLETVCQEF